MRSENGKDENKSQECEPVLLKKFKIGELGLQYYHQCKTLENVVFPHMRLESLPKIKRLVQSVTTNALVRQLTCLLFK